jgi:hypothetical protein
MVPMNSTVIKEPIHEHRNNGTIIEIRENLKPVKDLAWTYTITAPSSTPSDSRLFCDATGKLIGGVFTSVDNDNKIIHTMILSKGHIQTLHRYPNICDSLPFKSTMNNWQNLFFTKGVTVFAPTANENLSDGTHCLNAVIKNKTLPLGITCLISSTTNNTNNNNVEALIQAAKDSDLPFIKRYHHSRDGRFALCICQKGTLGDLFDIKAWIDSFKIVSKTIGMQLFSDKDFKEMESLSKKPLLDWLLYLQPPPLSNVQTASLGLVLGHPIQATVSELINTNILKMNKK